MTDVSTSVKQGEKEYTLVIRTTNHEFYKAMRLLGYLMAEQDKKDILKKKETHND